MIVIKPKWAIAASESRFFYCETKAKLSVLLTALIFHAAAQGIAGDLIAGVDFL